MLDRYTNSRKRRQVWRMKDSPVMVIDRGLSHNQLLGSWGSFGDDLFQKFRWHIVPDLNPLFWPESAHSGAEGSKTRDSIINMFIHEFRVQELATTKETIVKDEGYAAFMRTGSR